MNVIIDQISWILSFFQFCAMSRIDAGRRRTPEGIDLIFGGRYRIFPRIAPTSTKKSYLEKNPPKQFRYRTPKTVWSTDGCYGHTVHANGTKFFLTAWKFSVLRDGIWVCRDISIFGRVNGPPVDDGSANFATSLRKNYRVDPNVPDTQTGRSQTPSNPFNDFGPVVLPASKKPIRILPFWAKMAIRSIVNGARREREFFLVAKGGKNTPSLRGSHRRAIKTKGASAI